MNTARINVTLQPYMRKKPYAIRAEVRRQLRLSDAPLEEINGFENACYCASAEDALAVAERYCHVEFSD